MRTTRRARQAETGRPRRTSSRLLGTGLALGLVVVAAIAGVAIGARAIPVGDVVAVLLGQLLGQSPEGTDTMVVAQLRVPRTAIGLVTGLSLGVAGALAQAVTRNPLADPGLLGTNSGAAFALALGVGFVGATAPTAQLALAFVGALVATLVVYAIGSAGRSGGNPVRLVLAGTALGAVLAGITEAIVITDPDRFDAMTTWRSGSLVDRDLGLLAVALPCVVAGLVLAAAISSSLNAVALGDDLAASLGANVALVRTLAVVAITLLAGAATALAGPITFVGLMVPHVARWIVGPDQRWILALSALLGATLLVVADIVGRIALPPGEVPAGIVTAFVGAPVLIVLVRRRTVSEL